VITVLEYLVIAAAIGLVVFLIAVFVFGRGEQMSALSPRTSPSELPDGAIGGDDVRRIRFGLALRGYRMSDVDWTLDRLSDELDRLHRRVAELGGGPLPPGVGPDPAATDLFPGEPGARREPAEPAVPDADRPERDGDQPGQNGQPDQTADHADHSSRPDRPEHSNRPDRSGRTEPGAEDAPAGSGAPPARW
jgi:DivIVA domain-containing protein